MFNWIVSDTYMYKKDLALNNLQWLIYHQTKQNLFIFLKWLSDPYEQGLKN